jgi:hypothetical protein
MDLDVFFKVYETFWTIEKSFKMEGAFDVYYEFLEVALGFKGFFEDK